MLTHVLTDSGLSARKNRVFPVDKMMLKHWSSVTEERRQSRPYFPGRKTRTSRKVMCFVAMQEGRRQLRCFKSKPR